MFHSIRATLVENIPWEKRGASSRECDHLRALFLLGFIGSTFDFQWYSYTISANLQTSSPHTLIATLHICLTATFVPFILSALRLLSSFLLCRLKQNRLFWLHILVPLVDQPVLQLDLRTKKRLHLLNTKRPEGSQLSVRTRSRDPQRNNRRNSLPNLILGVHGWPARPQKDIRQGLNILLFPKALEK